MGNLVAVPVRSLRDTGYGDDTHLSWRIRALADVRLPSQTPLPPLPSPAASAEEAEGDKPTSILQVPQMREGGTDAQATPLLRALLCSYDWDCVTAERIVQCESRFDPAATNGVSWGLWQINAIHAYRRPDFWSGWMIPEVNTAWAYELWQEQGWGIWDCR